MALIGMSSMFVTGPDEGVETAVVVANGGCGCSGNRDINSLIRSRSLDLVFILVIGIHGMTENRVISVLSIDWKSCALSLLHASPLIGVDRYFY